MSSLVAVWGRALGALGRLSMYLLTGVSLGVITLVALALSFFSLVVPSPLELIATAMVLGAVCVGVNAAIQSVLRMPLRHESAVITAGILLLILRPSFDVVGLAWVAVAGAAAMASKYLIAWRGRHLLNPAAVGAVVVTVLQAALPGAGVGGAAWWVGAPWLAAPVVILGLAVAVRTERVRVVLLFLVVAVSASLVRQGVQLQAAGIDFDLGQAVSIALWSSPLLFLGFFMLTEPLTLPPRRWQRFVVAGVVGLLAGWPIPVGVITLGQEFALLIGNLIAFVWAVHHGIRLKIRSDRMVTPTVRELTLDARHPLVFRAGQYLELSVPHRRPDARGSRREFSIVSAPADAPTVRIAYRVTPGSESSYKRALGSLAPGAEVGATGVWGDFTLPRSRSDSVVLVAAGIGVTPFVSQLREVVARGEDRDIVLVYVASEAADLAYVDELAAAGVEAIVFTRDRPASLPERWRWARGVRLDADGLRQVVPDIAGRHAYISGPPSLIAELAPALENARSLTTDAFAGY